MSDSKHHKLFWGSSYDRGLDTLLYIWPDILKRYPEAQLHIAYGWDLFDKANGNNAERMGWKQNVVRMMQQPGIKHYGRVGQGELKKIRKSCGIWAYPTWFPEINCITALECQRDGCVPVTIDDFALSETVGSGIKVKGNIKDPKVLETYKKELIDLMGDKKRWKEEVKKGERFAKSYSWDKIAGSWDTVFHTKVSRPFVTVITPTIRCGWWVYMARSLSNQTYTNFEWLILDDYKEDRSEIAKEIGELYGINIRYIRGDKALGKYKRKYGLFRADNKACENAKGELLVFVQDFIAIPNTGIESLVDIYRHNPDALIAPVDQYWFPKEPNKKNDIDWWDGDMAVIQDFSWRNIRLQFKGIRESDNASDFELNYGAIPKAIFEHLGGWYEFMDDAKGLGYDNTQIAYRALQEGFRILIDDTNVAQCLDFGSSESDPEVWEEFLKGEYPSIRTKGE